MKRAETIVHVTTAAEEAATLAYVFLRWGQLKSIRICLLSGANRDRGGERIRFIAECAVSPEGWIHCFEAIQGPANIFVSAPNIPIEVLASGLVMAIDNPITGDVLYFSSAMEMLD